MMRVNLRRLTLLLVIRRESVTVNDVADAFCISYDNALKIVRGLCAAGFVVKAGMRPRTGRSPETQIYAPAANAREALEIPFDTPLVWPQEGCELLRRQPMRAPVLPVAAPARPVRRIPRARAMSGKKAAPITIGRGSRWGVASW